MSRFPDITYAHPNYPELLTNTNLKGHWLTWIKSAQRAQHPDERVGGKMREQLKILRDKIKDFNFPNGAKIPVFGVDKKMIDRNLEEKSKESGIKPEQLSYDIFGPDKHWRNFKYWKEGLNQWTEAMTNKPKSFSLKTWSTVIALPRSICPSNSTRKFLNSTIFRFAVVCDFLK